MIVILRPGGRGWTVKLRTGSSMMLVVFHKIIDPTLVVPTEGIGVGSRVRKCESASAHRKIVEYSWRKVHLQLLQLMWRDVNNILLLLELNSNRLKIICSQKIWSHAVRLQENVAFAAAAIDRGRAFKTNESVLTAIRILWRSPKAENKRYAYDARVAASSSAQSRRCTSMSTGDLAWK